MTRKTQRTKTTSPINPTPDEVAEQPIALDGDLRKFLREVRSGQCLALAAWATKILRARRMTMADLTRCVNLGFES
jgi:hypothetical protein